MIDVVEHDGCRIDVETDPAHRRRGLGGVVRSELSCPNCHVSPHIAA
jgi:hypothetical protein